MEFKKNDYVTVTIEDIGNDGEGIGKVDGFTLFIKDAVIGDTVEAKIMKSKKHYAYARLEKVVKPSPFRVEPKCAYHRQCGGCQVQALSYEKQLEFKQQKIRNNLIRIGGFAPEYVDERMEPIVGMDNPYNYRNKAQYPVGQDKEGNPITGFYAGHTHTIISNTNCHLGVAENEQILNLVLEHMKKNHISAYDETTGEGLMRHILIRTGFTSGEIMVCFVVNKRETKNKTKDSAKGKQKKVNMTQMSYKTEIHGDAVNINNEFIPNQGELLAKLAEIKGMTSVSVSINTEKTNVIMGKEIHTLWGSPTITDTIHVRDMQKEGYPFTGHTLTFKISPLSFYQVNPVQTEKLYSLALEYAGLTGEETVWDLYCGIGTISLFLADKAKQVYGVEIIPQAIEDAKENAMRNGITNAEFFVGKAEEVLPEFYEKLSRVGEDNKEAISEKDKGEHDYTMRKEQHRNFIHMDMLHPDVIVVDPPRKGCDELCLSTMLRMKPERIVYVSCDSATLSRDLKILCDGGYEIKRIRGVDQFAQTVHVETVCLLSKLHEAKHHVNVTLEMDELDITSAESKATYDEIKDYVLEKHGLQVTNLYIAQVKRKCGIIQRENYNKSQKEDAKQPQCPEDKEKAVRDALKHFGMI